MEENKENICAENYQKIVSSFIFGFVKLFAAKLVTVASSKGLNKIQLDRMQNDEDIHKETYFDDLLYIGPFEHVSFDYITTNSFLIYATTLFDGFLSETITFLYFLYPSTLGSEKTYTFNMLLQAESKNKLVEDIIKEKVKKLSYRSFYERLLHLENTYGLKIELSESGIDALKHYSSIRNVMVHNQSIYNISYNENNEIEVEQYNCPIHPTPIEDRDLYKAFRIYIVVAGEIYCAINDKVFKNSHSSIVTKTKEKVIDLIKTTFSYNINKKNFDSEYYEKALTDLQDNKDYSDLARKAREEALVKFHEYNDK